MLFDDFEAARGQVYLDTLKKVQAAENLPSFVDAAQVLGKTRLRCLSAGTDAADLTVEAVLAEADCGVTLDLSRSDALVQLEAENSVVSRAPVGRRDERGRYVLNAAEAHELANDEEAIIEAYLAAKELRLPGTEDEAAFTGEIHRWAAVGIDYARSLQGDSHDRAVAAEAARIAREITEEARTGRPAGSWRARALAHTMDLEREIREARARIDEDLGPADERYERTLAEARRMVADRGSWQPAAPAGGGVDRRPEVVQLNTEIDVLLSMARRGHRPTERQLLGFAERARALGIAVPADATLRRLAQ